jgi:hypothetical protein
MFSSHQKTIGTDYTATIAWLCLAFIFGPAALLVFPPLAYASVLIVLVWSVACLGFAAVSWQRYSRLSIPCLKEGRGWWK